MRMTVVDGAGQVVLTTVVQAGQKGTVNLFLGQGDYLVYFAADTRTGEALPDLAVSLKSRVLSEKIDPYLIPPDTPPAGGTVTVNPTNPTYLALLPLIYANPFWY